LKNVDSHFMTFFPKTPLFLFGILFVNLGFPCSESTVSINLEDEVPFEGASFRGPFHNVRRDNQDGLGTCYANTARNLLIGLSGGNLNPSYLDLAILYKRSRSASASEGLDRGNSCDVIKELQSSGEGICDQSNSPLETGDTSSGANLFFRDNPEEGSQAAMLTYLRQFFSSVESLPHSFKSGTNYAHLIDRSRELLTSFKNNPRLQFPIPILSKITLELPRIEKEFGKRAMPPDFYQRYQSIAGDLNREFRDRIIAGTTRDVLRERYRAALGPLWESVGLNHQNPLFESALNQAESLESARDSLLYFRSLAPVSLNPDEAGTEACSDNSATQFLGSLRQLVDHMTTRNLDPSSLVDQNGRLRTFSEIAQLAVAPNCIIPSNRVQVPSQFACDEIGLSAPSPRNDQFHNENRERILSSLRNGMPVGQTYQLSPSTMHINTIVGYRYHPEQGECQFLIRESMTGTSEWMSERLILNRARTLSIVERR
jgi:hypothetical protein